MVCLSIDYIDYVVYIIIIIIFLMCRLLHMSGYDAFPLQDGEVIHERLKCYHSCQLVMKDPVQTRESGFVICRECFNTLKYVFEL